MAKEQQEQPELNLEVRVEVYKPSQEDLIAYAQARQKKEAIADSTFNTFLQRKYYPNSPNVAVIADLSNMVIGRSPSESAALYKDLKGIDLSGSILKNTQFIGCDLTNAVLCDVDLGGAYFEDSKLKGIDFRGADLTSCRFSDRYLGAGPEFSQGIKYSTTGSWARIYADIMSPNARKLEAQERKQQKAEGITPEPTLAMRKLDAKLEQKRFDEIEKEDEIFRKKEERDEAWERLSFGQKNWVRAGFNSGNEEYDTRAAELNLLNEELTQTRKEYQEMEATRAKLPQQEYLMDPSIKYIFSSDIGNSEFDPAYVRGQSAEERNKKRQYVNLERSDVEAYITRLKTEPNLTLNDFAKEKHQQSTGKQVAPDTKIVADCGNKVDSSTNNKWLTNNGKDFSNLDLSKANLQGVSFSGSNLSGCNFTDANISGASFEGCRVDNKARFENTQARDANFFNANLQGSIIKDSDFRRAFMPRSDGENLNVENSNFDFSNIKDGFWDASHISDASFNGADLSGISLANADLVRVQAQHAIFNNAVLNGCKSIESDFTNSFFDQTQAINSKWQQCTLENIKGREINLSDAELDDLTKLDGADLDKAILKRMQAEGVSFANANLDHINAEHANLQNATLEGATARFANFTGATIAHAQAKGLDCSGSILDGVNAQGAGLQQSIMKDIQAKKADFTLASFAEADLQGSRFRECILKQLDARNAKMQAVEIEKSNLEHAKVDGAEVDKAFYAHENKGVETVEGEMKNGQEGVSFSQEEQRGNDIKHASNRPWLVSRLGHLLQGTGKLLHKAADAFAHPERTGAIAGMVIGAVIGVGLITTVVATAGIGLIPAAAICLAGGAALGGGGGYIAAKYTGLSTMLTTCAGWFSSGPFGAAAGAAAGTVGNAISKAWNGKSLDQNAAVVLDGAGNAVKAVGEALAVSKEQEKLLAEHNKAMENYQKVEKVLQKTPQELERDHENAVLQNQANSAINKAAEKQPENPNARKNELSGHPDVQEAAKHIKPAPDINKEKGSNPLSKSQSISIEELHPEKLNEAKNIVQQAPSIEVHEDGARKASVPAIKSDPNKQQGLQ